ncbi:helix-turn-helix domain-containing protein [Alcaligenaceae bacterium CGII-47]|nr:helix-turn-helix domain-containing protein [Alcaligenaceae bacterium CGII-47]
MKPLTTREESCLHWAAQGKTSWEIGVILGITERTVNFHIANICTKFNVHTRQAAIATALRAGVLPSPASPSSGRSRNLAREHAQTSVACP